MECVSDGATVSWELPQGGQEIFVVKGSLRLSDTPDEVFEEGSWVRHPASAAGSLVTLTTIGETRFWVKSGHL